MSGVKTHIFFITFNDVLKVCNSKCEFLLLLCSAPHFASLVFFRVVLDFLTDPQHNQAQGCCLFNNRDQPSVNGYRRAAFAKHDSYRHYDLTGILQRCSD